MNDDESSALAFQQELEARRYREDQLLKQARIYSGFRAECERFSADFNRQLQEFEHDRYQLPFLRRPSAEQQQVLEQV